MKLLILGSKGQVGRELQRSLSLLGDIIACSRENADLEKPEEIEQLILDHNPDIIINAAAHTAVDNAESEQDLAQRINERAVETLANLCTQIDALLVHYSTDYIFDGTKSSPYNEEDTANPISVYGKTKLKGEEAIHRSSCKHLIFRTSWVYANHGRNFIKTILQLAQQKPSLKIIDDQYGAPTSAALIADVTSHCLKAFIDSQNSSELMGTYHLTAKGKTSWYNFARHIIDVADSSDIELTCNKNNIQAISSKEYKAPAPRPKNSSLNCEKLEGKFGLQLPRWEQHVDLTLESLLEQI